MATTEDAKQAATALLTKLNVAVKAANEAQACVTTAQAELASRAKAVGLLLLEAKKLHPKVKDFDAYLKRVDGLGLSRAYDYLRLAGGRTTDAELKKDARERQRKSRAKKPKTLPKPVPEPKQPEPKVSVTVTESPATASNLDSWTDRLRTEGTDAVSARCLQEFENACRSYLPKLNEADLKKAQDYFVMQDWKKQKKAA
jgi:hypothetical protein